MEHEPVITIRRPAAADRLRQLERMTWNGLQRGGARLAGRSGFVRRFADHLYDLVDLRARERYEHRSLPR